MNPQLLFEIDFSFFTNLFSSKNDMKKKKDVEKLIHKNFKMPGVPNSQNLSNKESYKLLESDFTEKEIDDINKKESQIKIKYNDFSINIKEVSDKENILNMPIKEQKLNIKERIEKKLINNKTKKTKNELLHSLVHFIKNIYIFKKKVKLLIQKHKENFAIIINTINKSYLPMNIQIDNRKKTILKYTYEPILKEYVFYISRKLYRNKKIIKFTFINKKNESIVDPQLNTLYHKGQFFNVISLKNIRKIEKRNSEEFLYFLDKNYKIKHISSEETEENEEKVKQNYGNAMHRKIPYYSILKKRPKKRITSNKKITFSKKNEMRSYKKE